MSDQPIQPFSQQPDPWVSLRAFTHARIALGRTGVAIPLQEVLQFRMAHAHARDAVYSLLEIATLTARLTGFGFAVNDLHSRAVDRHEYLQRPDKGRRLNDESVLKLSGDATDHHVTNTGPTVVSIVLADGLSATAVNNHAMPLLEILLPQLQSNGLTIAPINLVQQGRVAVGDEVGMLQQATMVVVLIGERPGLSSPDSLGIYLTHRPVVGLTDEARNCISNVRPGGLSYQAAADKLYWFIRESLRLQLTGVGLKDEEGLLGN